LSTEFNCCDKELSILKITVPPHTKLEWHSHPMPSAAYLGTYADDSQQRQAWEKWNDELEGLNSNAKTLRRVSARMKAHLAAVSDDWPPGEWDYGMSPPRGQLYQILSEVIPKGALVLSDCADKIGDWARLLQNYCLLCKKWHEVAPRLKEGEIQKTTALLGIVKQRTGRCHFELMAPLINVGRRLTGGRKETAESLRRMWRREIRTHKHSRVPQQSHE
jgi:hypothetical protein